MATSAKQVITTEITKAQAQIEKVKEAMKAASPLATHLPQYGELTKMINQLHKVASEVNRLPL